MKKIFTLFMALIAFSTVFAQRGSSNSNLAPNNWNTQAGSRYYNDNDGYYNNRPGHGVVITNDYNRYQHDDRYNDEQRRADIDRINRDYDKRINDYRYNRRLNAYERARQIEMLQKERNGKLKAFGGGVLLGGILGVILGSHL